MNTISNSFLSASVKNPGAELCSLKSADGTELLWQADPAVWDRHSPILFPIVGRLHDNQYELDGKSYQLPQHGFARDEDFSLKEATDSSLLYTLQSTEATRANYPFEFELALQYRLKETTLQVSCTVENRGDSTMPFSIGAHPGFNLPGPLEECFLEFESDEHLDTVLLDDEGFLSPETETVLNGSRRLPLTPHIFDRDALIFFDFQSERITLGANGSSRRLTVDFAGFPQLGIWAKPNAPYVCIEPWFGYVDPSAPYGSFENKPGILSLPAGAQFSCSYSIDLPST